MYWIQKQYPDGAVHAAMRSDMEPLTSADNDLPIGSADFGKAQRICEVLEQRQAYSRVVLRPFTALPVELK